MTWRRLSITGSRCKDKDSSQPARSQKLGTNYANGDDVPRGDSSLFLWHVNPVSLLESVGLNIIAASGMSGSSSQSLPR